MATSLPPDCAQSFRATRLIAHGGFGAVFEAVQVSLWRPAPSLGGR